MANESDTERLRQLEARIAKVKGESSEAPAAESHYSQANLAWQMVIELVAGIVIGLGIGMGLDAMFGTKPFMLVLFILLGFVAGVRVMMRTAADFQERQVAKAAEEKRD